MTWHFSRQKNHKEKRTNKSSTNQGKQVLQTYLNDLKIILPFIKGVKYVL